LKDFKLSEGITYNNDEEYAEKLTMIKENYFKSNDSKEQMITEENVTETDEINETSVNSDSNYEMANDAIRRYADAISRTLKK